MIEQCEKCIELQNEIFKKNPERRGYMLCESCYEKSKEFYSYISLYYEYKKIWNR
jgi:hypothetical protein